MANEKWIEGYAVHNGKMAYWSMDCPHCFGIVKTKNPDERDRFMEEFKFCPFCGAKMDGGNEDG